MADVPFITLKSVNLEIPFNDLCIYIAIGIFIVIGIIIVLNMDNSPLTDEIIRRYGEDIRKGVHDKPKEVNLTFMSTGNDGNKPDQIIYDKNDHVGAKLPVLFPDRNLRVKFQEINGIMHRCIMIPYRYEGPSEIGILDYQCRNRYYITAPAPPKSSLTLLQERGISVSSGGLPLKTTIHDLEDNGQSIEVVYIYGDQASAAGTFKTEYSVPGEFYDDIHKK